MVAASERGAIVFCLCGGNEHDCPEGKKLIDKFNYLPEQIYYVNGQSIWKSEYTYTERSYLKEHAKKNGIMTKSYTSKETRIERFFLRIKRFRRVSTRYDKLDIMFCKFIYFVMIVMIIDSLTLV
jgi:hypothetical protein